MKNKEEEIKITEITKMKEAIENLNDDELDEINELAIKALTI